MAQLQVDVVHGPGEDGLTDTMAELTRGTGSLTWRVMDGPTGNGWPEVEVTGSLLDVITFVLRYTGTADNDEWETSFLEVVDTITL